MSAGFKPDSYRTNTVELRRDMVRPGMVIQSSHGYRLRVTEMLDTAEVRTDDRHVQISGILHNQDVSQLPDPRIACRGERYPAGSKVTVEADSVPSMLVNVSPDELEAIVADGVIPDAFAERCSVLRDGVA